MPSEQRRRAATVAFGVLFIGYALLIVVLGVVVLVYQIVSGQGWA